MTVRAYLRHTTRKREVPAREGRIGPLAPVVSGDFRRCSSVRSYSSVSFTFSVVKNSITSPGLTSL